MNKSEDIISKHGGYRKLKSFQIAQLIYDLTVRFCNLYINIRSRTHDQMVQAARSGVQNIAEGSQASGASKKFEIKLTSVARASFEELLLDYEDFLRHRGFKQLEPDNLIMLRFKEKRCSSLKDIRSWINKEREIEKEEIRSRKRITDKHGQTQTYTDEKSTTPLPTAQLISGNRPCPSMSVRVSPCEPSRTGEPSHPCAPAVSFKSSPMSSSALAANAALSLLNICCYLLDRQIATQADNFENEGGFTERLYRVRKQKRYF